MQNMERKSRENLDKSEATEIIKDELRKIIDQFETGDTLICNFRKQGSEENRLIVIANPFELMSISKYLQRQAGASLVDSL